ncbi:hypothetical protein [Pedobacter metabolipauper]|uniref:Uncharacterized protein n=1 Tax=Pedobacter metabolipauper TaxID=425513 RepID=A0A4R6T2T1_9SPHI|nr:hypothetical protein [Pedobacter metabolipauper]TDQ12038.1 hypothetical protein ATK78_1169 [Pedobacter metabolipauper]
MKTITISAALLMLSSMAFGQQSKRTVLPSDVQVRLAVMAAPTEDRAKATVYGYTPEGKFILLREGTNDMICLAPNPKQAGLFVYAYPKRLDPFMARGRELTLAGKGTKEKNDAREAEIKSGKLIFPQDPTVLYGYWGDEKNLDPATGEIKNALRRYVVYVPYATGESTGLPTLPSVPGMPWLMNGGTYKAHIMLNPESMGHEHGM